MPRKMIEKGENGPGIRNTDVKHSLMEGLNAVFEKVFILFFLTCRCQNLNWFVMDWCSWKEKSASKYLETTDCVTSTRGFS